MKLKIFSTETVPGEEEIKSMAKAKSERVKHLVKVNAEKDTAPPFIGSNRKSKRIQPSSYKTRKADFNKLVSVRIDHKTVVFVKAGTDLEKIKSQYAKKVVDYRINKR